MTSNLATLRQLLKKHKVNAFLISSVSHISYLTGYSNFSKLEREAYLLVTKKQAYIFTDGRYSEAIKQQVKNFTLVEVGGKTPLSSLLKTIFKTEKIKRLGIEDNNLTVAEHKLFSQVVKNISAAPIESLRIIKEKSEIEHIREACRIGDRAFAYILKKIKPGLTEEDVAWEMEMFIKDQGAGLSFDTITAFGKNSSVPHHHTGKTKLRGAKGEFILLDFGVRVAGYCSDMTRTIFFGQASAVQKKMYLAVREAQECAVDYIEKNIKKNPRASEADKIAREHIRAKGFPNFSHSLGHGIGLEVHEPPRLSPKSTDTLREGMVFSIEPGIYLPGVGGVRIEDLYLVEKGD